MSITDELREIAAKTECANGRCEKLYRGDLEHIADRIDAKHEEAIASMMNDALYHANDKDMADLGWYRALDADNQPIHADDEMFLKGDSVGRVTAIGVGQRSEWVWTLRDGRNVSIAHHACTLRHHKPTVEDVLREMVAAYMDTPLDDSNDGEFFAEYAAKLRLAGDAE